MTGQLIIFSFFFIITKPQLTSETAGAAAGWSVWRAKTSHMGGSNAQWRSGRLGGEGAWLRVMVG